VERLRVVAVQKLHAVGQLLASRFDDEVVVVAHEAERVAAPLVLRDGDAEEHEEEMSVAVVEEDRYPPSAARADVKDPLVRHVGARWASHASTVAVRSRRFARVDRLPHFRDTHTAPKRPWRGLSPTRPLRAPAGWGTFVRQYSFDVIRARGLE